MINIRTKPPGNPLWPNGYIESSPPELIVVVNDPVENPFGVMTDEELEKTKKWLDETIKMRKVKRNG